MSLVQAEALWHFPSWNGAGNCDNETNF